MDFIIDLTSPAIGVLLDMKRRINRTNPAISVQSIIQVSLLGQSR